MRDPMIDPESPGLEYPTRRRLEQAVFDGEAAIRPLGRLLLMTLLTHVGPDLDAVPSGLAPSLATLAAETGMARSAVAEYLNYLEDLGWVTRTKPARASRYDRTTYAVITGRTDPEWAPRVQPSRPGIPAALRRVVLDRDEHRCVSCGSADDLTLDHIRPWSLGGEDTEDNLRTLCRPCNSRKGARV